MRHDDSPEVIENRLKNFKETSRGILKYYHEHPRYTFVELDGEQSIDDIHKEITRIVSE